MYLLKFNGLLSYMYFQGLNYEDIYNLAHFIKIHLEKKDNIFLDNLMKVIRYIV